MKLRFSLTLRLTLLFATMSVVLLLGFAWLTASAIERHFVDLDREELDGKLELVRHEIERVDSAGALARLPSQLHDALVGHTGLLLVVRGADGRSLFSTPGAAIPGGIGRDGERAWLEWREDGRHYRGLGRRLAVRLPGVGPVWVAVAIDTGHHARFLRDFDRTLALFVFFATLASGFLGWLAARSGLAPLRDMKARVAAVTARKLDLRLASESVPVEMADLAATLNAMLERLEQAFRRLSDFSSDLAHELRTPISNLMMQTQVALSQRRSADSYREVLASNAEEFERLSRMISDMLFLAKADHGLMLPSRESVDLAREVRELFDFYDALAEEKRVALTLAGEGRLTGDRLMLRRALSNLLSNALRHTPDGGAVEVGISSDAEAIRVRVANSGEAIDPARIPRLFERFYRADSARAGNDERGTGLGLAIVKAIVSAHGGSVTVNSENGQKTAFVMNFAKKTGG